jgi:hypothetical protein
MLDIQGSDDVNPLGQDILDILVPLRVLAARHVGVRQLIDKGDLGSAGQYGVDIHFFHNNIVVFLLAPGDDFEPLQELGDIGPAVGLHESHDHIDPFFFEATAFEKHLVGLPYPRDRAEEDLEAAPLARRLWG